MTTHTPRSAGLTHNTNCATFIGLFLATGVAAPLAGYFTNTLPCTADDDLTGGNGLPSFGNRPPTQITSGYTGVFDAFPSAVMTGIDANMRLKVSARRSLSCSPRHWTISRSGALSSAKLRAGADS
jgi:hypothetical protein